MASKKWLNRMTIIKIPKTTVKELAKLKIVPREAYYSVIERLLAEYKKKEVER